MYETFYAMKEKPFSILPDPDLVYWGRTHSMAFAVLECAVANNVGLTVVTGEVGSGKTTLLRCLLRRLDPMFTVALISNTPHDEDDLLRWIMLSLRLPSEGALPGLISRLQDFVHAQHAKGRRTMLIIDEAQNLRPGALETLRMLSNVNTEKYQLLQIILVGQPQLRDALQAPQLLQFAQRVTSDFHLPRLPQQDVANYINYRLDAVGAPEQLFLPEACRTIADASAGIPRVINMLCDKSLVYGFAVGVRNIAGELVREVIEDKNNFGIFPVSGSMAS
ncbi:MAG: AAA family ATPase [Bradyrhizobium sp.]|nr:AAA family ATPase [Bradyrhizobium sp.]